MKGIILAGGTGSRLSPLTSVVSKQLLPVYDKPMIYYPLSTLMAAQIREFALISNPEHLESYKKLLGDGSKWGIEIEYFKQEEPRGIPEAYLITESFLSGESSALILGDNIFVGPGMGRGLQKHHSLTGSHILLYPVTNPQDYGVAEINSKGAVKSLVEKPQTSTSRLALTGLIFCDSKAPDITKNLKPSKRNELEITDLLNVYMQSGTLNATALDRGTAWLDMGQTKDLFSAADFVKVVQERQGLMVAAPEEIAWRNFWINDSELLALAKNIPNKDYSNYLSRLLEFSNYD
jgi:glucose-1-phosphate thymidylyltransferase